MANDASTLPRFDFYIDVFGFCNLRCPSCPVGNIHEHGQHFNKGLMSEGLLRAVLAKANGECQVGTVGLFNWTEPLLHPDLPSLIQLVHAHGNRVAISSNLNRLPNPDALMAAAPELFRVSLSGFRQEIYVRGHRHGDVEAVKVNMQRLAFARDRAKAKTHIQVAFHRYQYNAGDEAPMRTFSESLGFEFAPVWAMYMPAEKILSMIGDPAGELDITSDDRAVVSALSVDLREALALARQRASTSCKLLDEQIVIDVNGDVFLCCGTTSAPKNRIGSFLESSIAEIQEKKRSMSLCSACMAQGISDYFTRQDEFAALAEYPVSPAAVDAFASRAGQAPFWRRLIARL